MPMLAQQSLVGKHKMIAALERFKMSHEPQLEGSMMAFGINGKRTMMELLMSHPPLDKRIDALRNSIIEKLLYESIVASCRVKCLRGDFFIYSLDTRSFHFSLLDKKVQRVGD